LGRAWGLLGCVSWAKGEKPGGGFLPFLFFFKTYFKSILKICLKYFQILVKITHLKNKMHQHDLHTILLSPIIIFILKENIISPIFS